MDSRCLSLWIVTLLCVVYSWCYWAYRRPKILTVGHALASLGAHNRVFATCPENLQSPDGFVTITIKSDEKIWEAFAFCEPTYTRVFGTYQFYSHSDTVTKTVDVYFNTDDPDQCQFIKGNFRQFTVYVELYFPFGDQPYKIVCGPSQPLKLLNGTMTKEISEKPIDKASKEVTDGSEEMVIGKPTEQSTDRPTEKVTDRLAERVTVGPTKKVTDRPSKTITDRPTGKITDRPTGQPTGTPTKKVTDGPTEKVTDGPTEKVTDGPAEKVTDGPTEKVTGGPTEWVTQRPTQRVTDEPTKSVTDWPAVKVTDEPTEKVTDWSTEKITYGPVEKSTYGPVDKITDGSVDNMIDGPTVEPTEQIVTDKPAETVLYKSTERITDGPSEEVTDEPVEKVTDGLVEKVTDGLLVKVTHTSTEKVTVGPIGPIGRTTDRVLQKTTERISKVDAIKIETVTDTTEVSLPDSELRITTPHGQYIHVPKGGPSQSELSLYLVDIKNRRVQSPKWHFGRYLKLAAELDFGRDKEVSFQVHTCMALAVGSGQRQYILKNGCGDGIVFPKDQGFTTIGRKAYSVPFKAFHLQDSIKTVFMCTFLLCKDNCDGPSCEQNDKYRRHVMKRAVSRSSYTSGGVKNDSRRLLPGQNPNMLILRELTGKGGRTNTKSKDPKMEMLSGVAFCLSLLSIVITVSLIATRWLNTRHSPVGSEPS